jgi:hypothetical protein
MKTKDKFEITPTTEHVSEYGEKKTYLEAEITITELYGLGGIIFKTPLKISVSVLKDGDTAYVSYDFGMDQRIPVVKERNFLHNYTGDNPECDPIKTVFSTVKFDLMHAFHHYQGDPNYSHTHWALYGNLKDRVTTFDTYDIFTEYEKELEREPKIEKPEVVDDYPSSPQMSMGFGQS